MSAKHERVEALFNEALKLKPEERKGFLAEACGSDAELRRQVDELLQAECEAGAFLPEAPKDAATIAASPPTEMPGDQIGRYKLLQKLGEGGMGAVWMAEQREPEWHVRNSPSAATGTLEAVTYGSGLFVAVGGSSSPIERETILTSPDGVTWTARSSGNTNRLTAVVHGNGTFVALGTFSPVPFLPATATSVTSSNGIDWVSSASFPSNHLNALTYGNGVFVAVGYSGSKSAILTSSNGTSWTTNFVDTHSAWGDVAFGNSFFIAATSAGEVLTSPDGFTWTSRPPSPDANALTYGNGLFVLSYGEHAAVFSKIFTSPDGSDWTLQGSIGGQYFNNNGLAYGNGRFVLLGSGGRIARLDASAVPVAVLNLQNIPFLTGVTYGRGTFVAVGDQGVILQSDPLPTARLTAGTLSGQGLPLTISCEEDLSYRLQASAELPATNWVDLLTFTNTTPTTNFLDTDATNFNRRFYRVVSP